MLDASATDMFEQGNYRRRRTRRRHCGSSSGGSRYERETGTTRVSSESSKYPSIGYKQKDLPVLYRKPMAATMAMEEADLPANPLMISTSFAMTVRLLHPGLTTRIALRSCIDSIYRSPWASTACSTTRHVACRNVCLVLVTSKMPLLRIVRAPATLLCMTNYIPQAPSARHLHDGRRRRLMMHLRDCRSCWETIQRPRPLPWRQQQQQHLLQQAATNQRLPRYLQLRT